MVTGTEAVPVETLMEAAGPLALRTGGVVMSSVIMMTCGVPTVLPVTVSVALTVTVPV
jgi:magnesium-transporting ATPase (P-type)